MRVVSLDGQSWKHNGTPLEGFFLKEEPYDFILILEGSLWLSGEGTVRSCGKLCIERWLQLD